LLSWLVRTTLAPGINAPDESFTVPEIEDEVCVLPKGASKSMTAQMLRNRRAPLPVSRPPYRFAKLRQIVPDKIASKNFCS